MSQHVGCPSVAEFGGGDDLVEFGSDFGWVGGGANGVGEREVVGVVPQVRRALPFGVLPLASLFEGVDDGGWCGEGADGSGGLGGADGDGAAVAFASFADVDDAVVEVDVVPGQGGGFAGS